MPITQLVAHQFARVLWLTCECPYPLGITHLMDGVVWRAGERHCYRCGCQVVDTGGKELI